MLKVDFLNVGKGNCSVIDFPSGNLSIVDIDNSKNNNTNDILQDPVEFITKSYPSRSIFRFILTHPDMDHMSGLDELRLNKTIVNFWDTSNSKTVDLDKLRLGGYKKEDWFAYQELRKNSRNYLQDTEPKSYWKEDNIQVLAPSSKMVALANQTEEYNHCSYVIKFEYRGIRILLGGDASKDSWKDLLNYHGSSILQADVFLAPHHGSPENIEKDVFKYIDPEYVIISDHRGHSYDYSYYNSIASKQVYSTKHNGNISIKITETEAKIFVERNG